MQPNIKGFYVEMNSQFNNAPIVLVFTGFAKTSANAKTGDMIQSWILDRRDNPVKISKDCKDKSICGDCPQRHSKGGGCYVTLMHGPRAVYAAYKRGNYTKLDFENAGHLKLLKKVFKTTSLRIGSYGDPTALPYSFWEKFISVFGVKQWTGYTHSWRKNTNQSFKNILMASADNESEASLAQKKGWRTFRVRGPEDPILSKEFQCPASNEENKRLSCDECLSCYGTKQDAKAQAANVTIISHGIHSKKFQA